MSKNKLQRFEENETFPNLFQHSSYDFENESFPLKGNWRKDYFGRNSSLILELGCGRDRKSVV